VVQPIDPPEPVNVLQTSGYFTHQVSGILINGALTKSIKVINLGYLQIESIIPKYGAVYIIIMFI
jgi:hypothetical protein